MQDLPPGLTAAAAVIPAKEQEAKLTITAAANAAPGLYLLTIVGTATADKQTLVRKAIPVESVVQAFYIKHWVPTKGCVLEVKEGAFYTLSSSSPPAKVLEIKQGASEKVVVKVSRRAEGKFPVNLAVLPPAPLIPAPPKARRLRRRDANVQVAPIPVDKDEATVTISIPPKSPVGLRQTILLSGTMNTGKESVTRLLPAIAVKSHRCQVAFGNWAEEERSPCRVDGGERVMSTHVAFLAG